MPPGLHLLTWSLATSPTSGPGGIPIRHGFLVYLRPRQKVVLTYNAKSETVDYDADAVISASHLKTLDGELAPYPFAGLDSWKRITKHINETILEVVLGGERMLSGMTNVLGEEAEKGEEIIPSRDERGIKFVAFRLKKSWKEGAVGEEVTRYSKDKSWLFGHVVEEQLDQGEYNMLRVRYWLIIDSLRLLGQLQLAFILVIHLSSYGALSSYKRILALFTRSSDMLRNPSAYVSSTASVQVVYKAFVDALAGQLSAIPDGSFETELPELDLFFLDEIESLRQNIEGSLISTALKTSWKGLRQAGKKWRWQLDTLQARPVTEEEESDEEGEYAPQVVEI